MANNNCVFCNIINEREPATILYKDDDVVIFPDIRPAAKHHYLVVPRNHLNNAKHLTKEHISLVENLVQHGKRILEEKQADLKDTKFGFHWPPFNSISHLHLHVISPASQMSFIGKLIFQEGGFWFVKAVLSFDYCLSLLKWILGPQLDLDASAYQFLRSSIVVHLQWLGTPGDKVIEITRYSFNIVKETRIDQQRAVSFYQFIAVFILILMWMFESSCDITQRIQIETKLCDSFPSALPEESTINKSLGWSS